MQEVLRIAHLSKSYGKTRAVVDLSLSVEQGEIFGFIGPNGAGKSTTIRTVMNLIGKDAGQAYVFGEPFTRQRTDLLSRIGYLPSELHFYDEMTAGQLIDYACRFYESVDRAHVRRLVDTLSLDLTKKVEALSLGNQKKLGIVLALLHAPDLVIMDEASAGLDPLMQEAFYDILRREQARGATIFFSSHNLPEVKKLCSRVAFIREGQLVRVQAMDSLRRNHYLIKLCTADKDFLDQLPVKTLLQKAKGESLTELHFLYEQDINTLLSALSRVHVQTLSIEEPSLEEIFLHDYR